MRIVTELSERPPAFTVSHEGNKAAIIFYTDVAEKQREDGGTAYEAVSWMITRPWSDNIEERISGGLADWLSLAQSESYAESAAAVRAERNQLLVESDSLMTLDRLGLTVPSGSTFTAWLSFFKKLGEVLLSSTATYRQALRDITQQEGFPYNVEWPEKPGS